MHRRTFAPILAPALLAIAAVACGQAVLADEPRPSGSAGIRGAPAALMLGAMTLEQAVALAERRFKARVVRADTQRDGDRVIYVLRLLNGAGRVWTVRVDAQTGQMQ